MKNEFDEGKLESVSRATALDVLRNHKGCLLLVSPDLGDNPVPQILELPDATPLVFDMCNGNYVGVPAAVYKEYFQSSCNGA